MGCSISRTVVYTVDGKEVIESVGTVESSTPIRRKSKTGLDCPITAKSTKPAGEIITVKPTNKNAKQLLVLTGKQNPVYDLTALQFLRCLREDSLSDDDIALYISRYPESLFIKDADGMTAVDYSTAFRNNKRTLLFVNTKLNYRIARDSKRYMARVAPSSDKSAN